MGALTDTRKRSSTDLRLPLYPLFASPMKKLRVTSSHCPPFSTLKPVSLPSNPHRPQPSPPSHCIHAPQRNIRAFGLGSSPAERRRPVNATETVNVLSQSFQRKPDEGLDLHEYRKLVEERNVSPCDAPVKVNLFRSDSYSSELKEAELFRYSDVPSPTVDDERTQPLALEHVRKEQTAVKDEPTFKKLYAKTRERDAKLNELQFKVKVYQQKAHGFRNALEMLRIKKDKPKKDHEKLFGPLIDKEEGDVHSALFNGSSSEVLVTHESSNIVITREVIQCLRPGAWLNDEVINLYLELLKEREKREPKNFLKCHFFSTFFYKKLTSAKHGYDFKAVKRWTSQRKLGYALIECDKIFVPIHKEIHWCLAVINVKDECFQYLDSLGGLDTYALKMLARYLMDEIVDKSAKRIDTLSWKKESVDGLPLQKNGWDCGMFMLKYADFYSRGSKLCFNQDHMPYFRKRTALEILRLKAE